MKSPLKKYGSKILKQKCEDVVYGEGGLKELVDSMKLAMYSERGIGLAANQVGISKRIAVVDVMPESETEGKAVLINPEIIESEGEVISKSEGCLSIPDVRSDVKRSKKIKVKTHDIDGNESIIEAEGLFAVAIQHEIDHLSGILFIDKLSSLQRTLINEKLRRISKKNKHGNK